MHMDVRSAKIDDELHDSCNGQGTTVIELDHLAPADEGRVAPKAVTMGVAQSFRFDREQSLLEAEKPKEAL